MAREQKLLYAGTNCFVAALDPRTGDEVWRTQLPHGARMGTPVSIIVKGPFLYVGHYGHAYALDKRTGEVMWENGLPRMGYHAVLLAMEGADAQTSQYATVAAERHRQQQRQASQ